MKEEKTKVALVTGGNRGIGAGIVEVFAEKGYDIFLVHYGEKEKADAVADIVQNKYGRKCKCMDINLSNSDAAVKILNCVLETYGRIDALLSNAGMGYERYLTTAHVEEIDMIYKVNYRAGILLGREVGKYMKEHNIQGCMVFTSSVKAFQPTPIDGIYGGMKAALRRTVQSLSREMAPYNIRVNIVAPLSLWNNVESDFNQDCTDRMIKVYATSDKGVSFYKMGEFTMPGRYYDEPMTVQHKDGTLHMLVRLPDGIGEAFSKDGGKNWGHIQKSKFWLPNSRFYFGRLMSGNLLLVNHQIEREDEESKETLFPKRSHLSAWLSEDDGLTWSKPFLLDEREGISYPDVDQDEEGNIYIIYDYLRFKEKQLLLAKITEEDILNGQIKTMGSYLRRIVDQAG